MSTLRRTMLAGLISLGALGALAGTAPAAEKVDEYNVHFNVVLTGIDNPCTPEYDDITLNGSGHAVAKLWANDDGSWHSQSSVRIGQTGTAADGTGYVGNTHFRARTVVEGGTAYITADDRALLISRGTDPNFTLRLKVKVSFDLMGTGSTYEVVKDVAECRG